MLGRLASNAREHPVRFFLLLVAISAAVFIPMLAIFGAMEWTSIGPFQFQTARLLHYAVYFLAGIGVGAYGIERGLLAPDGVLARHWLRWTIVSVVVFSMSVIFMLIVITKGATMSPIFAEHRRRTGVRRHLRRDIVRVPRAVRALRHAAPMDLGQPQRERIRDVPHPLYVSDVAPARDSEFADAGDRKRNPGIFRSTAPELGRKARRLRRVPGRIEDRLREALLAPIQSG